MHPLVLYSSHSINTAKVARTIAEVLQCPVMELGVVSALDNARIVERWDDYSPLLIGSGVSTYFQYFPLNFKELAVKILPKLSAKIIGFFATWAGRNVVPDAVRELTEWVERAGHKFIPKTFACYGKTVWVDNPTHPTQEDLVKAKVWGEYVISFCSKA